MKGDDVMAEKNNATCSICGKPYHMCLSCKDIMKASPWKIHTDTSEHYKVFQIIRGYNTGVYTECEAKDKLGKVDLSDFDTFRDNIKEIINKIMNNSDNVVADIHEDVVEDIHEESIVQAPTKIRRKKVSEVVETE